MLFHQHSRDALKLVVYGHSGIGKTRLGCTAPKPLIVLFERQGAATIELYCREHGLAPHPTIHVETWDELLEVMRALSRTLSIAVVYRALNAKRAEEGHPEALTDAQLEAAIQALPYDRPEWLVVDSATEAGELMEAAVKRDAPPPKGKDGLPAPSMRHAVTIMDRFRAFLKGMRDLPLSVLFLALRDDRDGTETADRVTRVRMPFKSMGEDLMRTTNAVGVMSREQVEVGRSEKDEPIVELRRMVRFAPLPSWAMGKEFGSLSVEEPDVGAWVAKLATSAPETKQAKKK